MAKGKSGGHFMSGKANGLSRQTGHEHTSSGGTKLGAHEKRKTGKGIETKTHAGRKMK